MPWKLPAPEAGTWAHPEPKGVLDPAIELLPEAEELLIELLPAVLLLVPDALPEEEPDPQALRDTARVAVAARRAPRVMIVLFTEWCSFVVRTIPRFGSRGADGAPGRSTAGTCFPGAGREQILRRGWSRLCTTEPLVIRL
jgi:hypothetical protein